MKRLIWLGLLAAGMLAGPLSADDKDKKADGNVVDLSGVKAPVPAEWKEEKPSNFLRFKQFKLAKAKDDANDGELIIFKGLGGSVKDNVQRWKDDFKPPKGKKAEDLSKVTEMKVADLDATYVEVEGIYLFKTRPRDPSEKPQERPDHRLLGVILEVDSTPYQIRLIGPAKTVEQYKKGFDDWLKALKK